jgi:DNA-binding response OmpR family regulator
MRREGVGTENLRDEFSQDQTPAADSQRIYIVEDDEKLAELLARRLRQYGFDVRRAADFRRIDDEVAAYQPHLILLDVNLPYYDGFYWCRAIRRFARMPIIFLSARTGDMDKVLALEQGGDDYLTKPFHPDVLLAKVRALLRRAYGDYAGYQQAACDELVRHGLILDLRRFEIRFHDESQSLTGTERELLRALMLADGRTVTRDELLQAVWDDVDFVDDNTLTVNIARLRAKLANLGLAGVIATVRGVGYRLSWSEDDGGEADEARKSGETRKADEARKSGEVGP